MTPDLQRIVSRHRNASFSISRLIEKEKERALHSLGEKIKRELTTAITSSFKGSFPLWDLFDIEFDVDEVPYETNHIIITASIKLKPDAVVRRHFKADRDEDAYLTFLYGYGWEKEIEAVGNWLDGIGYGGSVATSWGVDPQEDTIHLNLGRYQWM